MLDVLCFDEFKSTKDADRAMSFLFCNTKTDEIIDILENRTFDTLKKYFTRFSLPASNQVKRIVIDHVSALYEIYESTLFPNANITLDKFHVVQLFSRALSKTHIQMMIKTIIISLNAIGNFY